MRYKKTVSTQLYRTYIFIQNEQKKKKRCSTKVMKKTRFQRAFEICVINKQIFHVLA